MNLKLLQQLVLGPPGRVSDFLRSPDAGQVLHRHRLSPFIWSRLELYQQTQLLTPAAALQLRCAARATLAQNLIYLDLLDEVTEAMTRSDIPSAPLKGLALLRDCCYRPGERPVSDLDLLIHPDHRARAEKVLFSLGFVVTRQPHPDDHCLGLGREGCNIGLHHELLPARRYWGCSCTRAATALLRTGGRVSDSKSAAAQLFLLTAHFVYSHGACGAIQLVDLLRNASFLAASSCPLEFAGYCRESGMTRGVMALLQNLESLQPSGLDRFMTSMIPFPVRQLDRMVVSRAMKVGLRESESSWHWSLPLLLSPGPLAGLNAAGRFARRVWMRRAG